MNILQMNWGHTGKRTDPSQQCILYLIQLIFVHFQNWEANPSYHYWVCIKCLDTIHLWHMFACFIFCCFFLKSISWIHHHQATILWPLRQDLTTLKDVFYKYFPYVFKRCFPSICFKELGVIFFLKATFSHFFSNSNHIKSLHGRKTSFKDVSENRPSVTHQKNICFPMVFLKKLHDFIRYHVLYIIYILLCFHIFSYFFLVKKVISRFGSTFKDDE